LAKVVCDFTDFMGYGGGVPGSPKPLRFGAAASRRYSEDVTRARPSHSAAANSATVLVLQIGGQRRGVAGRNGSAPTIMTDIRHKWRRCLV